VNISKAKYFGGFNPDAEEAAIGGQLDPEYKLASQFQGRRQILLQARFSF